MAREERKVKIKTLGGIREERRLLTFFEDIPRSDLHLIKDALLLASIQTSGKPSEEFERVRNSLHAWLEKTTRWDIS